MHMLSWRLWLAWLGALCICGDAVPADDGREPACIKGRLYSLVKWQLQRCILQFVQPVRWLFETARHCVGDANSQLSITYEYTQHPYKTLLLCLWAGSIKTEPCGNLQVLKVARNACILHLLRLHSSLPC